MKRNISKKTWFVISPYSWHEHHHSVQYVSLTDTQYTHFPKNHISFSLNALFSPMTTWEGTQLWLKLL